MNVVELYFKFFDDLNIYSKISIQILSLILFTFFASKLIKYLLFDLFKYFSKNDNLDNSIIVASKKPILFFMWLYCFITCSNLIIERIDESMLKIANNLKYAIMYLSVLIFLLKSISQVKRHYILQKEKYNSSLDYPGIDAVEKLSKVSVIIIWSIFALGKMGFNLNALLAFSGAGGILVGFAGKDLFTNIFGGLVIYLDKPFVVGDWIASPDKDIEGDVEAIGWRQTRILTFEKFPIYVPNSIFGTIVIQNKSRLRSRRIKETINIRYTDYDKVNNITSDILKMLKEHPAINKKYKMYVNFTRVQDGCLTLTVYTFTNTTEFTRFFEIKQDILLKVAEIIKENGAELAHPTQTIDINTENKTEKTQIIDPILDYTDKTVME